MHRISLIGQVAARFVLSSVGNHFCDRRPELRGKWLTGHTGWTLQGTRATRQLYVSGRGVRKGRLLGAWSAPAADWTLQGGKLDFARMIAGMYKDWLLH